MLGAEGRTKAYRKAGRHVQLLEGEGLCVNSAPRPLFTARLDVAVDDALDDVTGRLGLQMCIGPSSNILIFHEMTEIKPLGSLL